MSRLVSITLTAVVCDDTDIGSLVDVVFNLSEAPVEQWADDNGWDVEMLDAELTLNVEADAE